VARKFPIIRFDAAMTLTKRHYQRLWFPEPGTGGTITSRADSGLSREQFNQWMPEEFWRQVVDRVAREAPDTLLLAEAFWLLEGFFVRTLGMHRVYNSAFMNMLKDEENAKYRSVIKNTLEFNPEVLKRFVNFMSNPDEETAISQFGKDDKYFGICTMMVTLPGLPMFGHGQIEGFSEKYGMEYRHAKWHEQPDHDLIRRHEREIFPLLKKRYLFAGVSHFFLYDLFTEEGRVNENVFAYSNRAGQERALVIYNNKYERAAGWIRTSAAYSARSEESGERVLLQKTLGEGLGLTNGAGSGQPWYCLFRDRLSGLEYIRNSREMCERGLYVELGAFKYQVFVDFLEVRDNQWQQYERLAARLNGRGVPSLDEAWKEILFEPLHHAFRQLFNPAMIQQIIKISSPPSPLQGLASSPFYPPLQGEGGGGDGFGPGRRVGEAAGRGKDGDGFMADTRQKILGFLREAKAQSGASMNETIVAAEIERELETILGWPWGWPWPPQGESLTGVQPFPPPEHLRQYVRRNLTDDTRKSMLATLLGWLFLHPLGRLVREKDFAEQSRAWIDEWGLHKIIASTLTDLKMEETSVRKFLSLIKLLTRFQKWFEIDPSHPRRAYVILNSLLRDQDIQELIQVHRQNDILWFNKEGFEELLFWLVFIAIVEIGSDPLHSASQAARETEQCYAVIQTLEEAKIRSGYQVEKLMGHDGASPANAG